MQLDNLTRFGQVYQSKVVTCLIYDLKFLIKTEDILKPEFFDSEACQWIVNKIKEYYKKYKLNPTLEVFKAEIESEKNDVFKESIVQKLRESYDFKTAEDLSYIKDNFIEFCINQNWKLTVYNSVDDIKKGDYEAVKIRFREAERAGQDRDIGLMLLEKSPNEMLEKAKRNTIATPWDIINEITEGGIGDSKTGELFIIAGSPGMGKCVGKNTKIDIQYNEIGIEIDNEIKWYKPWEIVKIDEKTMFAYELKHPVQEKH